MEIGQEEYFLAGNSSCSGCGLEIALRWAMKALGPNTSLVTPASCLNVVVGLWPKTAPNFPFMNMAFAAGAAAATGVSAAFKAKSHRFPGKVWEKMTTLVFAGDGGTTDIGIQGLSGAAERNSNIIYCCYDNEAYMNTGIQRSSATPYGAWTTTTPVKHFKSRPKKDMVAIMAAHYIPYIATASIGYPEDMVKKVKKAKDIKGTRFLHVYAPCPTGWKSRPEDTIKLSRMVVQNAIFPLFEIEEGDKYTLNIKLREKKPVEDYLRIQGRFRHLTDEERAFMQKEVDKKWEKLLKLINSKE